MDHFQPPWSNPPSSPTLDFANGPRNLPPEVAAALGRFRLQTDDDRDRAVIQAYLDSGQADPLVSEALQQVVDVMGHGAPSQGTNILPTNLPTTPTGGIDLGQTSWNAGKANLPSAIGLDQNQNRVGAPPLPPLGLPGTGGIGSPNQIDPRVQVGLGMDTPIAPPVTLATTNRSGVNVDPQRTPRSRRPGKEGGANWKGIEGMGGSSAFANIDPNYLSLYASRPGMAAMQIAERGLPPGQHAPNTAAVMTPMVGSALAMAKSGLLGGGGRGHGLGGPESATQQLTRAENLLGQLGPGDSIDPAYVYSKTLRRARKTPLDELGSDPLTQIQNTQDAILAPLKGLVDDAAYTATSDMLQREAMNWMQGVATGEIDPNLISYPEWIRRQKRQHYLGR